LQDIIDKLHSGRYGNLDVTSVQSEYNTIRSPKEKMDMLRSALFLDSLSKCLEQCTDDARLWLLQNSLEVFKHSYRLYTILMDFCSANLDQAFRRVAFYGPFGSNSCSHIEEPLSHVAEFVICAC
jgi:hypothetical protein